MMDDDDDSFNHTTTGFRFNPQAESDHGGGGHGFSGILDIYVHHAKNIHNICIYDNQDVYAKFSLTCDPDETITTRIIIGGGKNPDFNQNLSMKITQFDVVLKCEIWMLSRAKNFMEDQLLGFALVPISTLSGKGKISQDYTLSSTDLFHSPAGTVKLTLSINPNNLPSSSEAAAAINSSITSEVVLLNRNMPESTLDPIEYTRIEFPDINVASENQEMVSRYFDLASFLHLGISPEYEMAANSSGESSNGFLSSTMTSLSDDRISSADSMEKKAHGSSAYPETPTSKKKGDQTREVENKEEGENKKGNDSVQFGSAFPSRSGKMKMEVEQSEIQQQIVDMYMRSMQQFTESLAKMKLPMDLDHHKLEAEEKNGGIIQNNDNNKNNNKFNDENKNKKDGSRVFYGSRAFF
ncbi:uncharacterized protein LOC124927588 [Impatiens glandulifera]|uniref:uncharacterized protein LOC124927588 n=1 Tax=Impatiens glandulifera TaxID=253017 RepID=UPI001FB0556D|nr:uncharacterized protein LOC124927588 [Impatiens glandulifera]